MWEEDYPLMCSPELLNNFPVTGSQHKKQKLTCNEFYRKPTSWLTKSKYMAAIKRITIYGKSQYMATINYKNYKKDYYFPKKKKNY